MLYVVSGAVFARSRFRENITDIWLIDSVAEGCGKAILDDSATRFVNEFKIPYSVLSAPGALKIEK